MSPCATPTPFPTLVALWAGELPPDEAHRVEEHVFGCDACAAAYEHLGALVDGVRQVIPAVISTAHRDRLVAAGTRLLATPVVAGVEARAMYTPEIDLLVHVLQADLSRAERVDLDIIFDHGFTTELVGVPFDAGAGQVLIACQRHYAPNNPTFRVHAVEGGVRREVGRYRVEHSWELVDRV